MTQFLAALFNLGESSCFGRNNKGIRIFAVDNVEEGLHRFFSVNPIDPLHDRAPNKPWHHLDKPRRADANVTAYRNFLVEIDSAIPLDKQYAFIHQTAMPWTTCVFSGNKSYHFVISLREECQTLKEYTTLARRIFQAIDSAAGRGVVDRSNVNPSRLSRYPGTVRPETGQLQTLCEVRHRVSREYLETWLRASGVGELKAYEPTPLPAEPIDPKLWAQHARKSTVVFVLCGAPYGGRHRKLYAAAANLKELGFDYGTICHILEPAYSMVADSTLNRPEWYRAIRNAVEAA